ncbi:MAG: Rieske 2Fe-2S domain-containing protein [Alphaproteobacteria bacterium]
MFLRNYWYAAGWSHEISEQPLARRLLDQPIALFRTASGKAAALDDCCPHRMAPLSLGTVEGETLRCGYHGLQFDCAGACVDVPGQKSIPPRLKVQAYPLVERWRMAWIWMGNPAEADPAKIPDRSWLTRPDWDYSHGLLTYDCNYVLLLDNLIDLSHTTFVHKKTIGTDDVARTPIKTSTTGDSVLVERYMNQTEPSPFYKKIGGFPGKVDRWQKIEFTPPTNIVIDAGAVPAGTNDKSRGIDTRVIFMITPATPTRTHQFWAFARDFKVGDADMTALIAQQNHDTFVEDKTLLDGQQSNATARPDQRMIDNNADGGIVQIRKVLSRLKQTERAASAH